MAYGLQPTPGVGQLPVQPPQPHFFAQPYSPDQIPSVPHTLDGHPADRLASPLNLSRSLSPSADSDSTASTDLAAPPYAVRRNVLLARPLTDYEMSSPNELWIAPVQPASLTLRYGFQGQTFDTRAGNMTTGELLQQLAGRDRTYPYSGPFLSVRSDGTFAHLAFEDRLSHARSYMDRSDNCMLVIRRARESARDMGTPLTDEDLLDV